MYELCFPRLQRIATEELAMVDNGHHTAILMSYYALMASVSDQQWKIIRTLYDVRNASAAELAEIVGINSKIVSAQLCVLRKLGLVFGPSKKGGDWQINSSISTK